MEGSFSLPITAVSSVQAGSVAPALQGQSPIFSGELGAFELLMQQLLTISTDLPTAFQQGVAMPFGAFASQSPVTLETPFELSEDGTIDVEQLSLLLTQLNLEQTDLSIPQILQEVQAALEEAMVLGQSTVDLGTIFDSATSNDVTALVDFSQSTSQESMRALFESMQKYFEAQGNTSQPLTQEQQQIQETLEQQLKELFPEDAQQKAEAALKNMELMQTRPEVQNEIRQQLAAQAEVASTNAQEQPSTIPEQTSLNTTPEYLTPEFLKQGAVLPQGEQVLAKVAEGEFFKQNNVNEQTMRETVTIAKGLTVDDSTSENSANMDMRNSLNLTMDGQGGQTAASQGSDGTESSNKLAFAFDQNLQRLQDAQSIMKQISKNVSIQEGMRTTEINMKLEPEYLGSMKINVRMENQVINAQIMVDNEHVKELLDSNMTALRSAMANSQIKVDKVDVEVSADAGSSNFINDAAQHGKNLNGQNGHQHFGSMFAQSFFEQDIPASSRNRSILSDLYQVNYLA